VRGSRALKYLAALTAILACALPASAQRMLLTGNDKALWVVRYVEQGKTYDVAAKPVDGAWQWIAHQTSGRPAAAAAVGDRLHLLFRRPLGYVLYDLSRHQAAPGRNPDGPLWPADARPVAMCDAAGVTGPDGALPTVLAVVARNEAPATMPATRPIGSAPAEGVRPAGRQRRRAVLGVFRKVGNDWKHLADAPRPLSRGPQTRLLAAAAGETLFVLTGDATDAKDHLAAFERGAWRDVSTAGWPAGARGVAMLAFDDRLVVVLAAPGGPASGASAHDELHLAAYDPPRRAFAIQPITRDGQAVEWPRAATPLAARLGDVVALVWRENDKPQFATCDLNGRLLAETDLTVFQTPPLDDTGQEIIQAFMWGVLFAVLVPILFLRPRTPLKPFTLPPTIRPANPLKRAMAGLIDFLPWAAAAWLAFGIRPPAPLDLIKQMIGRMPLSSHRAYARVTMLLLYTAYGIATERRFGATLGKMIFKLRVVGDDATPPANREILLRNLVRMMELFWPLGIVLLVLLPLLTRNRQRLGDMMARTTVVNARSILPPGGQDPSDDQVPTQNDGPENSPGPG